MKVNILLLVLSAAVGQTANAETTYNKIDCMLVKGDALFGAETARDGKSLKEGLEHLMASYKMTDEQLVKTKRKPTSIAVKTQAKMSFTDGYNEALRQPEKSVDLIGGDAYLACTFAKYK